MDALEGKQPQGAGQSQTGSVRSVGPPPQPGRGIIAFDDDGETRRPQGLERDNLHQGAQRGTCT